ncbi:MAG TPA: GNAT family protein [Polyangiaceae bacterium]
MSTFATDKPVKPSLSTVLETERLCLRPIRSTDIPELYKALRRNAEHLRPFSPLPAPEDRRVTLALATREVTRWRTLWRRNDSYAFFLFPKGVEKDAPVVGRVTLGRVTRGAFLNAYLGYFIDKDEQGKGLTSEAVRAVVTYAFDALGLHRVQAAIMPRNASSLRVAERCNFRKEGHALRYLQIAGSWENHDIFAVTTEEWQRSPRS